MHRLLREEVTWAWGPFTSSAVLGNQQQLKEGKFWRGGALGADAEGAGGRVCGWRARGLARGCKVQWERRRAVGEVRQIAGIQTAAGTLCHSGVTSGPAASASTESAKHIRNGQAQVFPWPIDLAACILTRSPGNFQKHCLILDFGFYSRTGWLYIHCQGVGKGEGF